MITAPPLLEAVPLALVWPLVLAFAWVVGEYAHRWVGLPRMSAYALVGFVFAPTQLGLLPEPGGDSMMLLAHIAFGLILFEFGYRINVNWLRTNAWLGLTALLESLACFAVCALVAWWGGMDVLPALLMATLLMSTSPASILRLINEQRCAGQVTERVLHLTAVNCVLSVLLFKLAVGAWALQAQGEPGLALFHSVAQIGASTLLGALLGLAMPALLRQLGRLAQDATLAFAIAVIVLVSTAHVLSLSPVIAALVFGLVARHRRVVFGRTQRNFGPMGELLGVLLFVQVAAMLAWPRVWAGLGLGLALIVARSAVKIAVSAALARAGGTTWRKGVLTGMAMTPISVFVILLLEQTRMLGVDLLDALAPLAALTLVLELVGPLITQRALRLAGEAEPVADAAESRHAA